MKLSMPISCLTSSALTMQVVHGPQEVGLGGSADEGGRDALAHDIADDDVEGLLVLDEVVKVAVDLLRRDAEGGGADQVEVKRGPAQQQGLLDARADLDVAAQPFALQGGPVQPVVVDDHGGQQGQRLQQVEHARVEGGLALLVLPDLQGAEDGLRRGDRQDGGADRVAQLGLQVVDGGELGPAVEQDAGAVGERLADEAPRQGALLGRRRVLPGDRLEHVLVDHPQDHAQPRPQGQGAGQDAVQ